MKATNPRFEKLKAHIGYNVSVVAYGDFKNPANTAVECEDCGCVLVDADAEGEES